MFKFYECSLVGAEGLEWVDCICFKNYAVVVIVTSDLSWRGILVYSLKLSFLMTV